MKFGKIILSIVLCCITSCKINRPNPKELAQFMVDINNGNIEAVKEAKKRHPNILRWSNDFGEELDMSYAHIAALRDNVEILKLVTDKNNATCFYKPFHETPFMFAVNKGNSAECVEYLMTYKQNYETINCYNRNYLHLFIDNKNLNLDVWNLIKTKINPKILNQRDIENHTPIQYLVITLLVNDLYESKEMFTIFSDLLALGANPFDLFEKESYFEGMDDNSYVQLLMCEGMDEYLKEMLKYVKGKIPNYDEYSTYLNLAFYYKDYEIIPILIPYIENINLCTKANDTILHWAVFHTVRNGTDKNFIKLLLNAGCDKTIIDNAGDTAYSFYKNNCDTPDQEILDMLKIGN